jgi:hypothetical protein
VWGDHERERRVSVWPVPGGQNEVSRAQRARVRVVGEAQRADGRRRERRARDEKRENDADRCAECESRGNLAVRYPHR